MAELAEKISSTAHIEARDAGGAEGPEPPQRGAGAGSIPDAAAWRRVADDSSVRELLDRVVKREIDPASAAKELLEREDG